MLGRAQSVTPLLMLIAALFLPTPAWAVSIDWVTVGGAGNACDVQPVGCFGAVATRYRISKTEVTNTRYAEFLNAVAATAPNLLYHPGRAMDENSGGIVRSGSTGSFTYDVIAGRESMPVNHVSFYSSLRFANWLQSGQPTGAQGNGTTEDGAYTITPAGVAANGITRNPGATIFLPNRDEWYKAAYYDVASMSYFDYPAGTDTQTTCAAPGATANTANCGGAVGDFTVVGSYTGSASPNGTFDQGGNVNEWNETIFGSNARGLLGGWYPSSPISLAANNNSASFLNVIDRRSVGFRVASLPEPGTGFLLMAGMLVLTGRLSAQPIASVLRHLQQCVCMEKWN